MPTENANADITELDALRDAYKAAVEAWVATIREEEALVNVDHNAAKLDAWQEAGFREEAARDKARAAKKEYEGVLREEFFNF